MRHGIFSEAITRFTKGQPAELTAPVLAEAARMMAEHAGAKRSNDIAESYPGKREQATINLSIAKINDVLGSHFLVVLRTDHLLHELHAVGVVQHLKVDVPCLADRRIEFHRHL